MPKPAQTDTATATSRRVLIRHPCEVEGTCVPLLASTRLQCTATMANVSHGGTMLIVGRRFEVGMVLDIEVQLAGQDTVHLPVSVAHVSKRDDGRYSVGCRFARPLPADCLNVFAEPADATI